MKKVVMFIVGSLLIVQSAAFASGCPDLSGKYRITDDQGSRLVTITQNGCTSLTSSEQTNNGTSITFTVQLDGIPRDLTAGDYQDTNLDSAQFNSDTLTSTSFTAVAVPSEPSGASVLADVGSSIEKTSKKANGDLNISYTEYDRNGKIVKSYDETAIRQ